MTGCEIAQNHCSKLTLIRDVGSPLAVENVTGEAVNMSNKKVTSTLSLF